MDMTRNYWEENGSISQRMKYESCNSSDENGRLKQERGIYPCCDTNLNFSTATCSEDDCEYGPYKKNKVARQDPMSHRIIEKRRRDRMNNCLADLSRLIPTEYLKKGRGRIEKTEIIEMAIKHMKYLQQEQGNPIEHYRLGYQECMSEAMRFMVEVEGHFPREAICVRLLNHLQKHCESISRGPHAAANTSTSETSNLSVSTHHEPVIQNRNSPNNHIQIKICDYQVEKTETEMVNGNNSNGFTMTPPPHIPSSESDYEKHPDGNNVSYKYKTNIKLRFNQDINSHEDAKRQKTEKCRRISVTSIENQSSSHSSPPSSEPCTRISDSENMSQQTASETSSINNLLKLEPPKNDALQPYSSIIKNQMQNNAKENFNVPIFVLHAKGSYYVPLTIDYKTLLPFLHNYDLFEAVPSLHDIVLHPVTISVNFLPNFNGENKCKAEYNNNWH